MAHTISNRELVDKFVCTSLLLETHPLKHLDDLREMSSGMTKEMQSMHAALDELLTGIGPEDEKEDPEEVQINGFPRYIKRYKAHSELFDIIDMIYEHLYTVDDMRIMIKAIVHLARYFNKVNKALTSGETVPKFQDLIESDPVYKSCGIRLGDVYGLTADSVKAMLGSEMGYYPILKKNTTAALTDDEILNHPDWDKKFIFCTKECNDEVAWLHYLRTGMSDHFLFFKNPGFHEDRCEDPVDQSIRIDSDGEREYIPYYQANWMPNYLIKHGDVNNSIYILGDVKPDSTLMENTDPTIKYYKTSLAHLSTIQKNRISTIQENKLQELASIYMRKCHYLEITENQKIKTYVDLRYFNKGWFGSGKHRWSTELSDLMKPLQLRASGWSRNFVNLCKYLYEAIDLLITNIDSVLSSVVTEENVVDDSKVADVAFTLQTYSAAYRLITIAYTQVRKIRSRGLVL